MEQKRRLINIPIVHTHADFGSLGSRVPFDQEVEEMKALYWEEVFNNVRSLPVNFSELRVYQDGLPNVSAEKVARIVEQAAPSNYDILRWLKEQGAHIVGTEDSNHLIEEYNLLRATLIASSEEEYVEAQLEYRSRSKELSVERVVYIAQRIKDTLPVGGTGLLFMGLAENVKKLIENEIEVVEPERLIGLSSEVLRKKLFRKEAEL